MSFERYTLATSKDGLSFDFYSNGPNGLIKKVISFRKLEGDHEIYNLGYGDYDKATGRIDDLSVSNNRDRDKKLATVAISVGYFFVNYPNAQVAFRGSSPARTRLYIMRISSYLDILNQNVTIEGLTQNGWEFFRKNTPYKALLITRKKM